MTGSGKGVGHPSGGTRSEVALTAVSATRPNPEQTDHARGRDARGTLSELTRTRLSVQLRAMYDAVAQQPVPDRFSELIARLDAADRNKA